MTDDSTNYKDLVASVYLFYGKSAANNVEAASLKSLLASIVGLLADCRQENNDEKPFARVLNTICIRILEKSNFTDLNCALLRLLTENCSTSVLTRPKYIDLLEKCLWRNVKNMPAKSDEMNYDAILLEMHEFMSTLPSSWWRDNFPNNNRPHQTIKIIAHVFVNIKGDDIAHHLKEIPKTSALYLYLLKVWALLPPTNLKKIWNLTHSFSYPHLFSIQVYTIPQQGNRKEFIGRSTKWREEYRWSFIGKPSESRRKCQQNGCSSLVGQVGWNQSTKRMSRTNLWWILIVSFRLSQAKCNKSKEEIQCGADEAAKENDVRPENDPVEGEVLKIGEY